MVCRLMDFVHVVLKLLMFKACGIIGIFKIEVFNFSSTERVKQNQKNGKIIQNLLSLWVNNFSSNFNKIRIVFLVFHWNLTLLLPVPRCAGDNTDLHSNSNISKTIRVNIAFTTTFFKVYSINFLMVCRWIDFAHVVLKLVMFNVCGIIGISEIEVFNFSGTERVKYFSI